MNQNSIILISTKPVEMVDHKYIITSSETAQSAHFQFIYTEIFPRL